MSRLSIRRSHSLAHADAQQRVTRMAEKLSQRYGATCRWQGDVLLIEHANVNGTVTVGATEIVIDARLGFALSLFSGRAEQEITRILDRELAG